MSFAIKGYQDNLKKQIEDYSSSINLIKSNPSNLSSIGGSAFGSTGISQNAIKAAKSTDVFSAAKQFGGNTTTASQSNTNQNTVANASTANIQSSVTNIINKAVNALTDTINSLQTQLKGIGADSSVLASTNTSGQAVKPKDNMPTDNQGAKKDSTQPKDNQKPNVTFGETTTTDKAGSKEKPGEIKNTTKPENKEKTKNTNEAQSSSELDKAALKEEQKQFTLSQQNLNNIKKEQAA